MRSLYESLLDVENIENIDESIVANWLSQFEIWKTDIDQKDIKRNGDKFDILPNKPIHLRINKNIPFKIGKLNGYLELNYVDLVGDHLVDECGGLILNYVKGGKKLKNSIIKINKDFQKDRSANNGVSVWKSAGFLSTIKNLTFDFTDAPESKFSIDKLTKNSLKNINFINCDLVLSNDEAKVTLKDIEKVEGVNKIWSNSGDINEYSFTYIDKEWRQCRK